VQENEKGRKSTRAEKGRKGEQRVQEKGKGTGLANADIGGSEEGNGCRKTRRERGQKVH
jgi:hypothetical protein